MRNSGWKAWVHLQANSCGSAAHKFMKVPLGITSTDIMGTNKSRQSLLDNEVSTCSELWLEGAEQPSICFGKVPRLRPLTGQMLKAAAKSFKRNTCALGGLHPRHPALLHDTALFALALLLMAAEAVGIPPEQILNTFLALFLKPTGGFRPTGWFQSFCSCG